MTLSVVVKRRTVEADRIIGLELVSAENEALPRFAAGAHIDLILGPQMVRQYSLCNAPTERHRYCIAVQLECESRGGSAAIHENVKEGSRLTIGAPRNVFPLVEARRTILIAGGIGVTPILSMAEQLSQTASDFELHYCVRSLPRAAFRERILKSPYADRARLYVGEAADRSRLNVTELLKAPAADAHVYVCGPPGLISAVQAATGLWPAGHVHYEHFDALPVGAGERAFDVVLKRSSRRIRVNADETAVDALARAGIAVNVSCQQGVCGTCLTTVLEGEPDHRDIFLTDRERAMNDQFTPCCSRAKSDCLVLDL